MFRLITFSLVVISAAPFSVALSAPEATPPSLSETLAWMDSTFNPHSVEGGSFGYGIEENYVRGKLTKRRTETLTYDGCVMTLHLEDDPKASLYSEIYTSSVNSFNLQDIDPNSIREWQFDSHHGGLPCELNPVMMVCDMERVEFQTRNKSPLIDVVTHAVLSGIQGADRNSFSQSKTFVSVLLLDNIEYATRFVKAFRHAIAVCGGKPSPF
jgi:hypothetical protein